jgi:hypothetical protein
VSFCHRLDQPVGAFSPLALSGSPTGRLEPHSDLKAFLPTLPLNQAAKGPSTSVGNHVPGRIQWFLEVVPLDQQQHHHWEL